MTLSTQISKTSFTGNGVTCAFPLPFPFAREADIKALLRQDSDETPLLAGTHYGLSGAGSAAGGTLTMLTPPTTGQTLVVYRAPAIVQEVDYVENAAFPAETHEAALDLLTMICQSLQEQVDRCVIYPVSTPDEDILDSTDFLSATQGNKTAARAAQSDAETARDQAEAARDSAQAFTVAADVSADHAADSEAAALAHRSAAQVAQGAAEGARDAALTAKTTAQTAQGLAEAARDSATGAVGTASASAGNAVSAAASAATSAANAASSAISASGSAGTAMAKAAEASVSAQAAAQSAAGAAAAASGGAVKVSGADTTQGYLSAKLSAGNGLSETIASPGSAESMSLAVALAANPGLELASGLLRVKASTGLSLSASGLAADAGTGAGKLVQLDSNAKLPAVDASQLTGLTAAQITGLSSGLPVGAVTAVASETVPAGYLECNGAAVSRSSYSALYAAIGIIHGQGDGSSTFNLPDYRGRFLRGWSHGQTTDPDKASRTAMATGGQAGDHVGSVQTDTLKSHTHTFKLDSAGALTNAPLAQGNDGGAGVGNGTTNSTGNNETRPANAGVMYCIKY